MTSFGEKPLKLAYIIGTYPEITTTFIDRELRTLQDLGIKTQILSIRRPAAFVSQLPEYAKIQQQVIYLLPANFVRLFFAHLFFALLRPRTYFGTLLFLSTRPHPRGILRLKTLLHFVEGVYAAFLLRGKQGDHLHAHFIDRAALVALIVSRLLKVPYSVTAHADDIFNEPVLAVEKISEAKFTVTVSEFNRKHLLQQYPGLDAKKLHVLHPWIDLNHFKPPAARPENNSFWILSVGRLVENKGHQFLITACHLLHQQGLKLECNIIGRGPLKQELEALIAQYDLQEVVHLLGEQPQSEVRRLLSQSDMFALACTVATSGDRDGMPVAIAEAMAMEIPVISTTIVGIPEMVQPGTGFLVPEKDAEALAEAIHKIYSLERPARIQMGKSGRAVIAEHFDLHKGVERLAVLFQHAASGNQI
ncbi:MAG TPA: glycosyltransferase [Anaerolineales bacterium]|nr:glycosyltransferase [Anaerolineales bacterium]